MNLKLAKVLRRMAKDALATMEQQAPDGQQYRARNGPIKNIPNTLRGVYRRLKKEPSVRAIAYQISAEQRKLPTV